MEKVSIKKNVILNTFYQILTLIIPFITAPYISRVLGADKIGIYSYTNSIQLYFSMFAALGTASYGLREISRNRNDKNNRSKLFWEIEILTIITSGICLLAWFVIILLSEEYKIYFLILTLNIFNTMFDISWFYSGLEQFKYTIIQNSIFKILGVILLFVLVKDANDLTVYMAIMVITTLLGTMSMWIYLPKFVKKVKLKELHIKKHFKETLVYFIPTIATSIYTVLDKTLIGLITNNNSENGYYEQATKIIGMTEVLTFTSLNTVFEARISYLFVENKIVEIKEKINMAINFIFFMGYGIMFGLIGVADRFVNLFYGQGYDKVVILLKILSPLVVIIGISNCLGSQYYNPAGLRSKSAKFIIIGSCINLILNLILIPKFWGCGACIATIISEITISILYLIFCNGFLTLKNVIKYSYKKIISGIIMFVCISIISKLNIKDIFILCFQVIGGVMLYILSLIIMKDTFIIEILKKMILKLKNVKEKIISEKGI